MSTEGGRITIYGNSFGNDTSDVNVVMSTSPCQNVSIEVPHEVISCYVMAGVGGGLALEVIVADLSVVSTFSYFGRQKIERRAITNVIS